MKAQIGTVETFEPNWRNGLILNDKGAPRALLANALLALREAPEWQGVLARDAFNLSTIATAPPPFEQGRNDFSEREWTGRDDTLTAAWLQEQGIAVSPDTAGQAVETVASEHSFHPVRDYLNGLSWDGEFRIGQWLESYLGAHVGDDGERREYVSAVGERFLISAVARIMQPGCKADHALILEGPQGARKSTALQTLAEPWFTDEIADLGSKDAALQMQGAWLIELSELDSLSRAEVSRVKSFITRTTDRFRPPYGRRVVTSPRQCVFAGTVNDDAYLRDATGNRRFWPVRCGTINVEALARDRDQLWAEAVANYHAGEPWWLDRADLQDAAGAEQQARYATDALDDVVADYVRGREYVTVREVLEEALQLDKARWDQITQNRVARCLKSMGWERHQFRRGDKRVWGYKRPLKWQ